MINHGVNVSITRTLEQDINQGVNTFTTTKIHSSGRLIYILATGITTCCYDRVAKSKDMDIDMVNGYSRKNK